MRESRGDSGRATRFETPVAAMSREIAANVKSSALLSERRQQIVAAAIEVFLEKGFYGASVRDVCVRAGITQGNLYNYVRSKDDILYLICDEATARYQQALTDALEGVADPKQRLVRAVEATVAAVYDTGDYMVLLFRESHALSPASLQAVLTRADSFYAMVRTVVAEAERAGHVALHDIDDAANLVTYVPTLFAHRRWRFRSNTDRERMIASATDFILGGLGVRRRGSKRRKGRSSR
jgi:AcrR family transcriptional regulator